MNQIVLDSYYLIKLHQEDNVEISLKRLIPLIYMHEAMFMNVYDVDKIYDDDYKVRISGINVSAISEEFKDYDYIENIMVQKDRLNALAKNVNNGRKKDLEFVYKYFKETSDSKIIEVILDEDSPILDIYSNPEMLYYYLTENRSIPKDKIKKWFKNYVIF